MCHNQFERLQQLNSQVFELYKEGQYSRALPYAEEALNIARNIYSKDNIELASSINNFGSLLEVLGRLSDAEPYYFETLEMLKRLFPNGHSYIASTLNNLGTFFLNQSNLSQSERYYRDALIAWQKLSPTDNYQIANSLSNLGVVLEQQGRLVDAEQCHEEALGIRQELYQEDHIDRVTSINNLATVLVKQGRLTEAEQRFKESLATLERLFPDGHPKIAYSLNNLGKFLKDLGRLTEAEDYLYRALEMRRELFPEVHPDLAFSLNSFGSILDEQGRVTEAIEYYSSSLEMRKSLFPDGHLDTAFTLNNMGVAFRENGQYKEAESYLKQALEMRRSRLPEVHPDIAFSLNCLGNLLVHQKRLTDAESYLNDAYEMMQRAFLNKDHPNIAWNFDSFGNLFLKQKRLVEAKDYYQKALNMRKRLYPKAYSDIALSYNNLGTVLAYESRYQEALAKFLEAVAIEAQITAQIFAFGSETDRLRHLNKIQTTTELLISLVVTHLQNNSEAIQSVFEVILQRKGLSTAARTAFNAAIYEKRYQHLEEQFQRWRSLGERIIYFSFNRNTLEDTKREFLQQIKEEARRLEKNLASQVPEIQLRERELNRQIVAERLPEGSVLIEFVRFYNYDFQKYRSDSPYYLAFILPAKQPDKVTMKVLGQAIEIEDLLDTTRQQAISHVNINDSKLIPFYNEKLDNDFPFGEDEPSVEQLNSLEYCYLPTAAIQLRKAIFDPLQEYFEDSQQLFIIPDGQLNLIPFQLLPLDEQGEELLIDRYHINYLSAAQDLFRSDLETQRPASPPLVIADPQFYLDSYTTENASFESKIPKNFSKEIEVANLREEKEKIKKLFLKRLRAMGILGKKVASILNVKPYLQEDALVTYLKNDLCPSILFIGTHGLYLPQKRELPTESISLNPPNRYQSISQNENPMLRSALTFAGAGTWLEGNNLSPKAETGFLFAQEVAELDLWANEMTVLLACNSGVGDISIGEGVFGLRRAFAVAGVKTLIMSLWSVPVKASALLIERFFDNLQQAGMKRDRALQEAQNYIRNLTISELLQSELGLEVIKELVEGKNLTVEFVSHWDENQKNQKPLSHPFYWAAWICQGEIEPISSFC